MMKKNEKGQSTIEFLSSFAFILTILFLYVKMALNITNGYLLHYATFMASRAYLVANNSANDNTSNDSYALQQAKNVFSQYSGHFVGVKTAPELKVNSPEQGKKAVYIGVWAELKQSFSYSKIIGGTKLINYISESFIGREPIISECLQQLCKAMTDAKGAPSGSCSAFIATTMVDNGC